jgi:uncharacterized repeat protein (TIGR01451 family)
VAQAAGVPAGTKIANSVTLNYVLAGKSETTTAIAPIVTVAELIDAVLTWQDGTWVSVKAGQTARVLTYVLTNIGNGTEAFRLVRNNAVTGDGFDPTSTPAGPIYLESNGIPGLQTAGDNPDTLYSPDLRDPVLKPDTSQVVYILSDIAATIPEGAVGKVELVASSTTPGAAGARPGTALIGLGDGGVDAVVGLSRAQVAATGGYLVSNLVVSLEKSVVSKVDPTKDHGDRVMPGTVLTYRVALTFAGTGGAQGFTLTDPLPVATTYVPGTLTVDGVLRTDADDGDGASVSSGVVSVALGTVVAPSSHVIEFKVTVN